MRKKIFYEGPDLSYHNGIVNIKQIRDAGYGRIGLRAGYGRNNIDQKYITNAQACHNLGVNVILYWFSYAYTPSMAATEADYAVAQAEKYWVRCPIAFDFEYDSVNYARKNGVDVTKDLATEMCIAFLRRVQQEGYLPVLYTNQDYIDRYFDWKKILKELEAVYIWYARYTSSLSESELNITDIWQFTSSARVPGVQGKVDLNKFYTDFEESIPSNPKPIPNINIQNFQKAANEDGYRDANGRELVEDGIDGPRTQYVRSQITLKAKMHVLVGSTGEVVRWHQERCNEILGYNQEVDGKYGRIARSNTMDLQKKLGLVVDGVAGYNTLQAEFYC
ncbi:MAG: hypothetical protein HFJ10_09890 [Lachnospiraceae bacterium]|jgi:lysozyme|nr:hypothetical protein [Lachnospiraceae bacterium]